MKLLALVIFPSIGTLYLTVSGIWGLPAAEQVVGTIVSIDTFLGVIIKLGDASYSASEARYDGQMVIEPTATGTMHSLQLKDSVPIDKLDEKKELIFKVKSTEPVLPSPPR